MLEILCMQFQDRVPSLQEIVTGAEGIEASRTGATRPTEATVTTILTYKKISWSDQKKTTEQRSKANIQCYNCSEVGHLGRFCKQPNKYKGHKCRNCGKMNHHE